MSSVSALIMLIIARSTDEVVKSRVFLKEMLELHKPPSLPSPPFPFPSPPFPLPFHPSPLPLPSPSPPLRSRPPLLRLGSLGERFSSPSGSGLKISPLVATIFRSFSGIETSNYDRHVGCLQRN